MTRLHFSVIDVHAEPYAVVPTLLFRLRITETTGVHVHAIALRSQIQIEPRRRQYSSDEEARLYELFDTPPRWGETLRPLLWTQASLMVPGFHAQTETVIPIPCTYDFEVTAAKYFHALESGEIPLLLLFSGTVFTKGQTGFSVAQVSWDSEAAYRLPVHIWRNLMDRYFPDSTWLRLRLENFNALYRFKVQHALLTWDDTIAALLRAADGGTHV